MKWMIQRDQRQEVGVEEDLGMVERGKRKMEKQRVKSRYVS
jgi:hypothetical protein